jgi:DNA helicase HerA-like ATPase
MPSQKEAFISAINASYKTDLPHIFLGAAVLEGEIIQEAQVNLGLRMMNRHGLVAGATGSGKTRTLQLLAEQLSDAGVPVFMTDVKGDLSGLGNPGIADTRLQDRAKILGIDFEPNGFPVEFYSLSGKKGAQMRATVLEFGPVLLSKIFELNDTQAGVLSILFKYADDKKLPMVDLSDLKKVLNYLSEGEGAEEIKDAYGKISSATSGTILRKIVALEQQGVSNIFGETSFDIQDLMQKVDGKGLISLLNLSDMQSQPVVFSTFLLSLLAELYTKMPEAGDLDKPKLVFFLDEAHLLFNGAPKAFLEQIEQIIRLIRSKGIGIFFCTQMPQDIPSTVLSQLGNRVQHVLRAFTPQDAEGLKQTVKTYPRSDFYEIDRALTTMGIGQALITVLNEKGIPTEVAVTHLCPPRAVMGPMPEKQYNDLLGQSDVYKKYQESIDPQSAYEILSSKLQQEELAKEQAEQAKAEEKAESINQGGRREKSTFEQVLASPVAKEVGKQLVRGLFGMMFGTPSRSSRSKKGMF